MAILTAAFLACLLWAGAAAPGAAGAPSSASHPDPALGHELDPDFLYCNMTGRSTARPSRACRCAPGRSHATAELAPR